MIHQAICILTKDNKVLLGLKRIGMGTGNWSNPGGHVEPNETPSECAIRETEEELSITVTSIRLVGKFLFHFKDGVEVLLDSYIADAWAGEPTESKELGPLQWFDKTALPFDEMWPADRYFMPRILAGEKLKGEIFFTEGAHAVERYTFEPADW